MQHVDYTVRYSLVPANFSFLNIKLYSSVRKMFVYIYTKYSVPFTTLQPSSTIKGKNVPIHAWTGLEVSRGLRLPGFLDRQYIKVTGLSAIVTARFYPQEVSLAIIFVRR